jgi:hypothetical protein
MSDRVIRWFALGGFAAQVAFVLSWLIAALWQGPNYSSVAHTISDMYAVTAPRGVFLVVVITLCGLATVLFALLALWPTLRPSGWLGAVTALLLTLSIYGLGDLLTPWEREACRLADAGCTEPDQASNLGGLLDAVLSTIGIFLFIAAVFFAAEAMKRTPGWESWAWPARWVGIAFGVLLVALVATESIDVGGLLERALAALGAAAIAAVAWRIFTRSSATSRRPEAG